MTDGADEGADAGTGGGGSGSTIRRCARGYAPLTLRRVAGRAWR